VEIGRDHTTLENKGGTSTILSDSIAAWEVVEETRGQPYQEALDEKLYQPEVLKRIVEIEARFQTRLHSARIDLKSPDFAFPLEEISGQQKASAIVIWDIIKNRYEYAQKISELSPKFGRIQLIASDLKSLIEHFPDSAGLKRYPGYVYSLLGNTLDPNYSCLDGK